MELIDLVNCVISNDLTQMANFPTRILDCDSHSPALLNLFLSSDTLVFVLQWLSFDWEMSIMLLSQFPLIFHHIYNGMPCFITLRMTILVLIWDGLCDHLRDNPWKDIIKLSASAAASEFCEWVQAGIDVYIPLRNCQVKSHSSPWFSAACSAAIVCRNYFFCTKRVNLLNLK